MRFLGSIPLYLSSRTTLSIDCFNRRVPAEAKLLDAVKVSGPRSARECSSYISIFVHGLATIPSNMASMIRSSTSGTMGRNNPPLVEAAIVEAYAPCEHSVRTYRLDTEKFFPSTLRRRLLACSNPSLQFPTILLNIKLPSMRVLQ
jgi:hypothetical protein